MLIWFVIIYWVVSVGIGLWAGTLVKNSKDFAVAGRALPLYVVTATVFATWFGSETVLGDRKSTRLNSSHMSESRMPSSA